MNYQPRNIQEICSGLREVTELITGQCSPIPPSLFFQQPETKWSIAQNITHLITSAAMTRIAYRLPRFLVRIYGGRPNRKSRSYDELVSKYKLKLEQGGKASGRFIPKPVSKNSTREKILSDFSRAMRVLIQSIEKGWTDEALDQYIVPHPLLGKITLRELGFFTLYHTLHHSAIIERRLSG